MWVINERQSRWQLFHLIHPSNVFKTKYHDHIHDWPTFSLLVVTKDHYLDNCHSQFGPAPIVASRVYCLACSEQSCPTPIDLSTQCLPTSLWRHRQLSTRGGAEDHTPSLSSLPTPSATPLHMTVRELQEIMNNPALAAGQDYLVIDVRRDDMDVCRITFLRAVAHFLQAEPFNVVHPAAVNLPAQSFYQTLPMIYCLLNR